MRLAPLKTFAIVLTNLVPIIAAAQPNARNEATTEGCARASLGMFVVLIVAVIFLTSRVARQRHSRRPPPV